MKSCDEVVDKQGEQSVDYEVDEGEHCCGTLLECRVVLECDAAVFYRGAEQELSQQRDTKAGKHAL